MARLTSVLWERRLARLFTTGLSARATRRLRAAVRRDGAIARQYERYARCEAALCGEVTRVSPFAIERGAAELFAALDEQNGSAATALLSRWRALLIAGPAIVGAAAVLVLLLLRPAEQLPQDRAPLPHGAMLLPVELTARGTMTPRAANTGVRLFRVARKDGEGGGRGDRGDRGDRGEGGGRDEGGRGFAETRALSLDDLVTFTYANVDPALSYLMLFGVQRDGRIRWYYPGYDGAESVVIASDVVDEPLGDGIRLRVNHTAGPLCIVALFSNRALASAEVARRLTGLDACDAGRTSPTADGADVVTHAMMVEIGAERAVGDER